jgi:hypothetical protein
MASPLVSGLILFANFLLTVGAVSLTAYMVLVHLRTRKKRA